MLQNLKISLYFLVARYFRFFARIRLKRWNPRVVLITGSNGKTLALNLCELQLGAEAKYSHHANSAFGIAFDILGLRRTSFSPIEWIRLACAAPLHAWRGPHPEKIYVVEADGDRSGEGHFLGSFLSPEVCVWISVARTHSMLFEKRLAKGSRAIDELIAHEFGDFMTHASRRVIANIDSPLIVQELKRVQVPISELRQSEQLERYAPSIRGTEFTIRGATYRTPHLLPKEAFYAIAASVQIAEYFGKQPTHDLSKLAMPAGRSSVLRGVKNTTIIDSSYNANVSSVAAIVRMAEQLEGERWLILGDLTEQGRFEQEEHERLARLLAQTTFKRIITVGPRMRAFARPVLDASAYSGIVESFINPKEALDYLQTSLSGNEILTFKGARFLEGIIEHLLADPADAAKLCRREPVWQRRRAKWNL